MFKPKSSEDNSKKKKSKVKASQVYLEMLANSISHGAMDKMHPLSSDQLQIGYDTVYSDHSSTKFYIITVLPPLIDKSFFEVIRNYCRGVKVSEKVYIHYLISGRPHVIDWNSREMKSRRNQWIAWEREKSKEHKDSTFVEASQRDLDNFDNWRKQSWDYVQDADDRLVNLLDTEMIVEIRVESRSSDARRALRKVCTAFEDFCAKNKIRIRPVKNTLIDFLRYTSMTAIEEKSLTAKTIANRTISDEIIADMCTYTAGKLNDTGVFLAIDSVTGLPVYKRFVRSNGEAENFLVMAETGGGKSFMVKGIVIQAFANYFHQIILDVDGEYRPITQELGGVVIDMSKGNGLYFDSVQISDLTGDPTLDATLFTEAQTATTTVFNALCDQEHGMTPTEEKLYNDAYANMLHAAGVSAQDNKTWPRSKQLNYFTLYQSIKDLATKSEYDVYADELRALIDKLCVFFEPDGLRRYMFARRISINEILQKRTSQTWPMLIDIVLNLESSTSAAKRDGIESTLKQITATYLVTLLTNYFKGLKQFTVHYIEEYQRYSMNKNVSSLILYMITGNRKRNAITFIITNSPRALVSSMTAESQAVVDNINNFIIGKLKPNTVADVCGAFNLGHCQSILHQMSENDSYKHMFLVKINDKDTALVRQSIPAHIASTPLFATRTTTKK